MNEEWDGINNEDNTQESDAASSTIGADSIWSSNIGQSIGIDNYIDPGYIRSNEMIRISSDSDFRCSRHGRAQSIDLFASRDGMQPRQLTCCLECYMDLLARQCEHTDTDEDRSRRIHEETMRRMEMMNSSSLRGFGYNGQD